MPGIFVADFDLHPALDAVRRDGAAVVPRALANPFRRRLERELMELPLEPAPRAIGPVRQETEVCVVRDLTALCTLRRLSLACSAWQPPTRQTNTSATLVRVLPPIALLLSRVEPRARCTAQ